MQCWQNFNILKDDLQPNYQQLTENHESLFPFYSLLDKWCPVMTVPDRLQSFWLLLHFGAMSISSPSTVCLSEAHCDGIATQASWRTLNIWTSASQLSSLQHSCGTIICVYFLNVRTPRGIQLSTLIALFMWKGLWLCLIQSPLNKPNKNRHVLKAVRITRICYTSAGFSAHINSRLRSLVVCSVPGRSHWKFHASLHTENVFFIPPTESQIKGKRNERMDWMNKKKKESNSWMRMAYLCRCDWLKHSEAAMATHTQQSEGPTWSQVWWNGMRHLWKTKEGIFPSNRSKKRTSAITLKENRRNVWNLKYCKT